MSTPLEPRRGPTLLLVVVAIAAIAVVIVLLLRGGGGGSETGDIAFSEGGGEAPAGAAEALPVADIVDSTVRRDGEELVFIAQTAANVPAEMEDASIDWRWDLTDPSGAEWIVSASLNVALNAAVLGSQNAYGSTTIDGSMPGSIEARGDSVIVRLDPSEIKGFPDTFRWRLATSIVADRTDPQRGRAEDKFPNDGDVSHPES